MFGDGVMDEITSNVLAQPGYPKALSAAMVGFVAMIPVTKTPLKYVFPALSPLAPTLTVSQCTADYHYT